MPSRIGDIYAGAVAWAERNSWKASVATFVIAFYFIGREILRAVGVA